MKVPELLAPGGSFAAACQAFEAGADGVYLGLTEFSARKAATNFSLEQLRRIRGLARQRDRRIYITINTVIREEEMERVASLCGWLESLEVDGVIVQDLGTCFLLARSFPRIAIHASTQMAIHNDSGLRFAEELGIRRVILSRELPFERIRDLRVRHPGVELEVFIHGALCYSFSGVCLASWALAGRSANRGDCAQICRSAFCPRQEDGGGGGGARRDRQSSPFSCRDLSLGSDVLKLVEIGIDSLKIEGRMKSPEYVFHVTRLYREILDKGSALSETELQELQRSVEATFSREKTRGFFASSRAEKLLTGRYPGHLGALLGTVMRASGREIGLSLRSRLSLHDGIGYWPPAVQDPVIFPVRRIIREGRSVRFAEIGDVVSVPVEKGRPVPRAGIEIRQFSSRFLDRPEIKETSVPAFRISIDLEATLREEAGEGTIAFSAAAETGRFSFSRVVPIVSSTGGRSFEAVFRKLLEGSGSAFFTLKGLSFLNETGRPDTGIFVQPSELKRVRKELFAALDSWFLQSLDSRAQSALSTADLPAAPAAAVSFSSFELSSLSRRDLLSPPAGLPMPFASPAIVRAGPAGLSSLGGFIFLPLPPVMMDDEAWLGSLQSLSEANPQARFAIGLNNVGHLDLADRLADRGNLFFFIDFFLYVANRQALSFLLSRVRKLLFVYAWIEGDVAAGSDVVRIAEDFSPPLFYSLGCYERHALGQGQCREECPQDFTHELRQGRNRFTLVVRDCVTYLFQKEERHGGIP